MRKIMIDMLEYWNRMYFENKKEAGMKTIIKRDGSTVPLHEWQEERGLDSEHLAPYLRVCEVDERNGDVLISELIIDVFSALRTMIGRPLKINSGYRSQEHQDQLITDGYRAAKLSPHTVGMALDIDTDTITQTRHLVDALRILRDTRFEFIRIGWRQYQADGNTFVHADVCPAYFACGNPYAEDEAPKQWKRLGGEW